MLPAAAPRSVGSAGSTSGPASKGMAPETESDRCISQPLGQALRAPELWLLLAQLTAVMGGGLMLVSNAARIMVAKQGDAAALVTVVSAANALGRVAIGAVADSPRLEAHGLRRPHLLAATALLMAAAQVLLAVSGPAPALLAGLLAGLSYGAAWTLCPTLLADLCGLKHFGVLYGLAGLAPMLGSLLLSSLLATAVFERHASPSGECRGDACFQFAHLVTAAVCLLAAVAAGAPLVRRTRPAPMP